MSECEAISRRKALSLGLAALFSLAATPTLLPVSEAEAQQPATPPATAPTPGTTPPTTPGTERRLERRRRRQARRAGRRDRRRARRAGRRDRRQARRAGRREVWLLWRVMFPRADGERRSRGIAEHLMRLVQGTEPRSTRAPRGPFGAVPARLATTSNVPRLPKIWHDGSMVHLRSTL